MSAARDIVVVTGVSGGGKTTAIRALEDLGFFCVDNLPALLVPKLAELAAQADSYPRIALCIDVRELIFLKDAPQALEAARAAGHHVEVLFLDAADEVLLRRFSETRRKHPLAHESSASDGIRREREALKALRDFADQVIDTSGLNVHELKGLIQARYATGPSRGPAVTLVSFGYRYGIPTQADMVFDVRFLPNPYFVPALKPLTGLDPQVAAYVLERFDTQEMLERVGDLARFLLPRFQREGKSYLTLAVGCTGGKHRSVALAEELARRLGSAGTRVQVMHRDVERE